MITEEKHAYRMLFFRDHGGRRGSSSAEWPDGDSHLPLFPEVTFVGFAAVVTTFAFE